MPDYFVEARVRVSEAVDEQDAAEAVERLSAFNRGDIDSCPETPLVEIFLAAEPQWEEV